MGATILNNDPVVDPVVDPVADPVADPVVDPVLPDGVKSIYGDLEVKWPEGTADELKNDPSLKPFVDQEGNITTHNLMKSYVLTKKQFGKEKMILPTENSTKEEIDEFYNKLYGYDPVIDNYKLDVKEEDKLDPTFAESVRKFAHDNRLSPKVANDLYGFLNEQAKLDEVDRIMGDEELLEHNTEILKKEQGEAYPSFVAGYEKVVEEYIAPQDPELAEAFLRDPKVGSNPLIVKVLGLVGKSLYKEGTFGDTGGAPAMTPQDVERSIAAILGDDKHPYHNANHPEHKHATSDMLKLFDLRAKHKK